MNKRDSMNQLNQEMPGEANIKPNHENVVATQTRLERASSRLDTAIRGLAAQIDILGGTLYRLRGPEPMADHGVPPLAEEGTLDVLENRVMQLEQQLERLQTDNDELDELV